MNEKSYEFDETQSSLAEVSNSYDNYITETSDGLNIEANNINANCITSKNEKFSLDSEGNLTVNSLTINNQDNNSLSFETIFNRIYPIGSIYISTNDTNPGILFVGTWEKIEGKFLLGSNSTYTAGSTGGEATHTLTTSELPAHTHPSSINASGEPTLYPNWGTMTGWGLTASYQNAKGGVWATGYRGENQPHNNMPPYLAVNIWKRVS